MKSAGGGREAGHREQELYSPSWLATLAGGDTPPDIKQLLNQGRQLIIEAGYRQAYALFMRASQRAHEVQHLCGEVTAMALLSYAAANLGHNEEAIETAMLAAQLAEAGGNSLVRLTVLNYLGVALLWNGSHEGAEAVLKQAYDEALSGGRPGMVWQLHINRCLNEAYRVVTLRQLERRRPDGGQLQALLDAFDAHVVAQGKAGAPGSLLLQAVLQWLRAMARTWQQGGASAHALAQASEALAARMPEAQLLPGMQLWLRCELALVSEAAPAALQAAQQMHALCQRIEQQPLQRIALLLSSELHERQGQAAEALACLRLLQQREHQIRQVSMSHRRTVAALHFELRQHKQEVQSLKSNAQQLQRLSMEDALTGLANRRGLELRLAELLGGGERPEGMALYLSVIDVDRFKSVNDRHSHQVGDQVLKALSALFQQSLRGQDMAGRWGGDEFVLAFWAHDDEQAEAVGERLKRAVAAYPWGLLATGLCVSISLGLTRARADDSLDTLLLRSDLGMYAHKRKQPAGL
jgi:diguanylate cyclase